MEEKTTARTKMKSNRKNKISKSLKGDPKKLVDGTEDLGIRTHKIGKNFHSRET